VCVCVCVWNALSPVLQIYSHYPDLVSKTGTCSGKDRTTIRDNEGCLSSHGSTRTGCGIANSPWIIVAMPGQTIKLSIIDFGSEIAEQQGNQTRQELTYGHIIDGKKRVSFGRTAKRERSLYESKSNSLLIEMVMEISRERDNAGFIIHFQSMYESKQWKIPTK